MVLHSTTKRMRREGRSAAEIAQTIRSQKRKRWAGYLAVAGLLVLGIGFAAYKKVLPGQNKPDIVLPFGMDSHHERKVANKARVYEIARRTWATFIETTFSYRYEHACSMRKKGTTVVINIGDLKVTLDDITGEILSRNAPKPRLDEEIEIEEEETGRVYDLHSGLESKRLNYEFEDRDGSKVQIRYNDNTLFGIRNGKPAWRKRLGPDYINLDKIRVISPNNGAVIRQMIGMPVSEINASIFRDKLFVRVHPERFYRNCEDLRNDHRRGNFYGADDGIQVMAIDLTNGETSWCFFRTKSKEDRYGKMQIYDGKLMLEHNGEIILLDIETGAVAAEFKMGSGRWDILGETPDRYYLINSTSGFSGNRNDGVKVVAFEK